MKWYHYIAAFFAGVFLVNAIPHFVHGVSGDLFPSPFADPPGKGPSAPVVNVLWGGFNLVIGYILLHVSKTSSQNKWAMLTLFIGGMLMAAMIANHFAGKLTS